MCQGRPEIRTFLSPLFLGYMAGYMLTRRISRSCKTSLPTLFRLLSLVSQLASIHSYAETRQSQHPTEFKARLALL